ncbi:hypothetical protein [Luteolibacter yonseiensis]|uniref:hypothetical protein n=1 Tax=Luteolibacter yonseiensis TaxID=1144680 RepID=UPI001F2051F5|nr:hypothetical protein [Luteolibacter yonseiensis]
MPASWWKTASWLVPFGMLSFSLYLADIVPEADTADHAKRGSRPGRTARPAVAKHQTSSSTLLLQRTLASGNASDKEHAMRNLLPDLMARDIASAARMAQHLEPWAWREEVLFQVAREWARQDPTAAAAWARELGDATERDNVFSHVCIAIAKDNPHLALDFAEHHRPLRERILKIMAAVDSVEAILHAEKLTDAEARQRAFASIALGRAEESPREAARLVAEHLASGPLQDETALAVLHKWIMLDPEGAREWVGIFPDGPLLDVAESQLAAAAAYPASR